MLWAGVLLSRCSSVCIIGLKRQFCRRLETLECGDGAGLLLQRRAPRLAVPDWIRLGRFRRGYECGRTIRRGVESGSLAGPLRAARRCWRTSIKAKRLDWGRNCRPRLVQRIDGSALSVD